MVDWTKLNSQFFKATAFKGIITKHHIIYSREIDSVDVRISFSDEIGGTQLPIDYRRRGRQLKVWNIEAARTDAKTVKPTVDKNKKDDLKKLCQYLPVDCRAFYNDI